MRDMALTYTSAGSYINQLERLIDPLKTLYLKRYDVVKVKH